MLNLTSNETIYANLEFKILMKKCSDILTIFILIFIMLVMGMDTKFKQLVDHLKMPIGIITGMVCQFLLMPLLGFTLAQVLQLTGPSVLGVLLVSCCPGGALSNIITYFLEGDVSLSVAMTSASTLLALGFMPFNFWLYGHWVDSGKLVIPFEEMIKSLAFVSLPAGVGILFAWKFPKTAYYFTKIGSYFGLLLIAACMVMYNIAYPDMLLTASWRFYTASIIMNIVGFALGYGLGALFKRKKAVCKTIAVESGVQNVAIAFGVIALTPFTYGEQKLVSTYPMLYGITMTGLGTLIALVYQFFKCISDKKGKEKKSNSPSEAHMEILTNVNLSSSFNPVRNDTYLNKNFK